MRGKPKVSEEHKQRVLAALARGRWIKGRDLSRYHGIPTRIVRAVAEETGEVISSQAGYKLTRFASDEEIRAAQADLMSRSRHMKQRAALLEAVLWKRDESRELLI